MFLSKKVCMFFWVIYLPYNGHIYYFVLRSYGAVLINNYGFDPLLFIISPIPIKFIRGETFVLNSSACVTITFSSFTNISFAAFLNSSFGLQIRIKDLTNSRNATLEILTDLWVSMISRVENNSGLRTTSTIRTVITLSLDKGI